MTRKQLLQYALLGALLAALLAFVLPRLEWVEEKRHVGARDEAEADPNYAARLLIQRLGYRAEKIEDPTQLTDLPTQATLHIGSVLPEPAAAKLEPQIVDWVRRGGHLVIAVAGPEQSDRFTATLGLQRIGRHNANKPEAIRLEGRVLTVQLFSCDVFKVAAPLIWSASVKPYRPYTADEEDEDEDDDEPKPAHAKPKEISEPALAIARWPLGKGLVTAICDNRALLNGAIGEVDHAELTARILLDGRGGPVYFAPEPDYPTLPAWLIAHAPKTLGGVVLLILLALWRAIPRFGPLRREAPPQRPGLLTHLRAVGLFYLGRKDWDTLLKSLRDELRRLAQQQANGALGIEEIAHRAGVPASALHSALNETDVRERREFTRHAALLTHTLDVLRAHRTPAPRKPSRESAS
ncbi:MAG: hypothetical protein FWD62_10325 [Betaproteobacteria bacterium]|nr:hypothetical protein [Betaproteobacteria bacterium]